MKKLKPTEPVVWWLTEADYCGFEPGGHSRNPLRIPNYVWRMFCDRAGRGGRFRLWTPSWFRRDSLPVGADDPRWDALKKRIAERVDGPSAEFIEMAPDPTAIDRIDAGGLVVRFKDARDCLRWGGVMTTLTLDPI